MTEKKSVEAEEDKNYPTQRAKRKTSEEKARISEAY